MVTDNGKFFGGEHLLTLMAAGTLFAGPPCNDIPLVAHQRLIAGDTPREIASGDLNGDGLMDLVTVNSTSDDLSIFLGAGNGTFADGFEIPVGDGPFTLAVRDITGDGILDAVVPLANADSVRIMIGDGLGGFAPGQEQAVGINPKAIALGDFNGDSIEDLAVANVDSDNVSVLLGQGGGLYGAATFHGVGNGPRGCDVADLNGDGSLDIVTADEIGGTVSVLFGNGDGTFGPANSSASGAGAGSVVAMDFDLDGDIDLATSNGLDGTLAILLNTSNGTFATPSLIGIGADPRKVGSCDLDSDGIADLIVPFDSAGKVATLFGNGDGTFSSGPTLTVDLTPQSVICADLNGDSLQDLCVTNTVRDAVSVIFGRGNRAFDVDTRLPLTPDPFEAAFGDLNRDGASDLVVAVRLSDDLVVRLGNGDGTFQAEQRLGAGVNPTGVTIADLNGDANLDLVSANVGSDDVSIFFGNGNGTFGAETRLAVGNGPWSVAVRDFNGDSIPDLAVTNFGDDSISLCFGNGNGTFGNVQPLSTGNSPFRLLSDDFNGDGAFDLAYPVGGDDALEIRFGNGNGTFQSPVQLNVGQNPESITISDLDGDGVEDIVVTNNDTDDVSVLLGNGNGTFQAQVRYGTGGRPDWVASDDLNGDAIPDLVVANDRTDDFSVLIGLGNGAFEPERRFAARDGAHRVALADLDNDGSTDIAIVNRDDESVSVLINEALATVYWNGNGGQLFSSGSNWNGGVAPSLDGPNAAVFDATISNFDTVESVVLTLFTSVRSMFQANNEVQLNLNGNDFVIVGESTFRDGPIGLELGTEQCAGPDPLPVLPPVFRVENSNLLDASLVTPNLTIGRDGPAILEVSGANGRAILNSQRRIVVGDRGEGMLRLRTTDSEVVFGELADPQSAIVIGANADGTISVENAARVSPLGAAPLLLGVNHGATGTLEVVGTGNPPEQSDSRFAHLGDTIIVGDQGRGEIRITNGGRLLTQAIDIVLANGAGSTADVLISGETSVWTDPIGELTFGDGDSIDLTVEDGGKLNVAGGIVVSTNGTLQGNGTVSEVVNFGDIAVRAGGSERGSLPARLTIDGDYDQFDDPTNPEISGRLFLDLVDTGGSVESGVLDVNGQASLAGGLIINAPAAIDADLLTSIDVLEADSINSNSGRFNLAFLPGVTPDSEGNGRFLKVNYPVATRGTGPVTVTLTVDTLSGQIELDSAEVFDVNGAPVAADVGDLDNDGLLDVALALPDESDPENMPGQAVVLINGGVSLDTWAGFTGNIQFDIDPDPTDIAVGNVDAAGGLDLAVTSRATDSACVYRNDGLGLMGSFTFDQAILFGGDATTVAFGELDEDKWDDLAVGIGPNAEISVIDNSFPPGTLGAPVPIMADEGVSGVETGDVNMDGVIDLVSANSEAGSVSVILGRGDGTFEPVVNIDVGGAPGSIVLLDLDDDTDPDIVFTSVSPDGMIPNTVEVLRNDLTDEQLIFTPDQPINAGSNPAYLFTADTDGDGQPDLLTLNADSGAARGGDPVNDVSLVRQSAALCPGDCNGDGAVNFSDLVAMLGEFGTAGANPGCDADGSGGVDFSDLVAALGVFGVCE